MTIISTILAFGIVFGIIVLVHEFGHFFACRLVGVRVEVFSFGFGKRLWGRTVGDTDYRLSLIPLGGYVKMAGEEEYDANDLKPYEYPAKNRAQRMLILVMGPLMNLLLAYFIFTTINITGVEFEKHLLEPPRIGYVEKDSPAGKGGIQVGDVILTVADRKIANWRDLGLHIGANPNEKITVAYLRDGKTYSTDITVGSITKYNVGDAGLYWAYKTRIEEVEKNSPAEIAGFKVDDIILEINGNPVTVFEVSKIIGPLAGQNVVFTVQRKNSPPLKLIAIPREVEEKGKKKGIIGVQMVGDTPTVLYHYSLLEAMAKAKNDMVDMTFFIFSAFRKMVVGKISPKQLSGPLEIARFSRKAMERGPGSLFMLIGFISLQLGLVNLLPIPVLDGGHLLVLTLETIIRRDFNFKVKTFIMNMGLVFLFALMGFVILNDLAKLLPNGWSSFWPF